MMLAQLVTEEAVSKRLESERPGVKGFRRRAAEEILDHSFETLSRNETGRLKLEYLRGRREEDEGKSPSYSGKTREWMELLKHASETADTMELIRVTDELYNSEHTVNEITQCDGIKIGCIARLSEQKGLPYLIQAMSLVTNPSVSLFLIGDGELKNDLINQTKELALEERIHFLGYRSDVVECINSFDFCVLPSIFEGFGLVAIEAFMNGKTMIATDIPGVNEVVNSGNGILVPAEDPQALAQAIKKLAEDPEKRASLAARAKRDYDNKFSYPIFLDNYRNFYQSMRKGSK